MIKYLRTNINSTYNIQQLVKLTLQLLYTSKQEDK